MDQIASALGASSNSEEREIHQSGKVWLFLDGSFDGNTVTLEYSHDDSTYQTLTDDGTDQTFTAATAKLYDLPAGIFIRVSTDGTGSPSINAYLQGDSLGYAGT